MLESFDIPFPNLPPALDGFRILHLSDPHAKAGLAGRLIGRLSGRPATTRPTSTRMDRLARALEGVQADLVAFTGDVIDRPWEHPAGRAWIEQTAAFPTIANATLGTLAVFGNHDGPASQRQLQSTNPPWHWLQNTAQRFEINRNNAAATLTALGLSEPEDALKAALADQDLEAETLQANAAPNFTIMLCHIPSHVQPAARMGIDLVLAGHTHAGQIRLNPRMAPHTSCDLPPHLASGCLRLNNTLCCINRGLGETVAPIRLRCPPQVGLYTLRVGPLPAPPAPTDDPACQTLQQVIPW